MAKMEYSLIIEGFKAAGDMGAANGPPKTPGNGGTSATSGDGGGESAPVDAGMAKLAAKAVKLQEKNPGFMGKLAKKMGINVGLSSILKQSQIFTGTIGSIFQIFGALVDVILAPFLPIIVPIIRLLGNLIPMIHKSINGIIGWYDNNISPLLTDFGHRVGGWISDNLLGWLPQGMQDAIKGWFDGADWGKWLKNLLLGALVLGVLGRFGFLKLLTPIAAVIAKIPILGPLIAKIGGLAMGIARALIPGFGKLFPKASGGALRTHDSKALQASTKAAALAKGGGGFFGKLKGGLSKLSPKSMLAAAKSAGPMGIVKGLAKKAIPGISSAFLMYQGIKGSIDVFSSNMAAGESFWKSVGKASTVGATALAASALSFVPGGGLIAPIVGGILTDAMKNKMMAATPEGEGGDVHVSVHVGETEIVAAQIDKRNAEILRATQAEDAASVAVGFTTLT